MTIAGFSMNPDPRLAAHPEELDLAGVRSAPEVGRRASVATNTPNSPSVSNRLACREDRQTSSLRWPLRWPATRSTGSFGMFGPDISR